MTPRLSEDMPRPVQLIIDLRTKDFLSLHRELVYKTRRKTRDKYDPGIYSDKEKKEKKRSFLSLQNC
jgi:hypothetical protein